MRYVIGAIAAIASVCISAPAFAAACTVGTCTITDGTLSETTPISIGGAEAGNTFTWQTLILAAIGSVVALGLARATFRSVAK